ncbi:MAG TPA: DUF63 family protein [archaeon]|nr:DUF63 family protein [archaeon]
MDFDLNYFIHSVLDPSKYGGYQWYNAPILWGLFVLFYYFLYLFFKKNKIKIDAKLAISLLPYFIFGTIVRSFTDSGLLPESINPLDLGFYTHSPGLWIGLFFLMIVSLFVSKKLFEKRFDFVKVFGLFGVFLAIVASVMFLSLSPDLVFVLLTCIAIGIALLVVFFLLKFLFADFKFDVLNSLAILGQMIDGIATVIITNVKNCGEQHVVSGAVLNFSPLLFPILKILLVVAALHLIDKNMENGDEKNFVKIVIIALGFMTGPRNVFTAALGNCN